MPIAALLKADLEAERGYEGPHMSISELKSGLKSSSGDPKVSRRVNTPKQRPAPRRAKAA